MMPKFEQWWKDQESGAPSMVFDSEEAMARAAYEQGKRDAIPEGFVLVPKEPTEDQWVNLARDIMMWLDFDRPTPQSLFDHLRNLAVDIPDWLQDEPEMRNLDHVPSKGTRCVIIYKAMIAAAKKGHVPDGDIKIDGGDQRDITIHPPKAPRDERAAR